MTPDEISRAQTPPLTLRQEMERGSVPVEFGIESQSLLGMCHYSMMMF